MDKNKNEQFEAYVIKAENQDGKIMFYQKGYCCGHWCDHLYAATIFLNYEEAEKIVCKSSEFTKENKMSDGVINPPFMLYLGTNVSEKKPDGVLHIDICKIELNSKMKLDKKVKKKIPKKIIYEY